MFLQISILIMISEGLCDTEDWSNDAENSALHYKTWLFSSNASNLKLRIVRRKIKPSSLFNQNNIWFLFCQFVIDNRIFNLVWTNLNKDAVLYSMQVVDSKTFH